MELDDGLSGAGPTRGPDIPVSFPRVRLLAAQIAGHYKAWRTGVPFDITEQFRASARALHVPGPDVEMHDEDWDGDCYCALCLSYSD